MAAASAEAKKILSSLPLMAYDLGELFASKKASTLLSLQVPTVPPSLPYFLCDLPAPAFAAVVALCEAGQLSFTTVGAQEGKISLIGAKPRCPLLTLDAQPGIQYLLPMRLVAGVVPGAAGGGGAGRFFSAGAAGTAFRCGAAKAAGAGVCALLGGRSGISAYPCPTTLCAGGTSLQPARRRPRAAPSPRQQQRTPRRGRSWRPRRSQSLRSGLPSPLPSLPSPLSSLSSPLSSPLSSLLPSLLGEGRDRDVWCPGRCSRK